MIAIMDRGWPSLEVKGSSRAGLTSAIARAVSFQPPSCVIAASGTTPTLDVTIESDDAEGMASATTRLTFTQATATTSEWQELAGAVTDDWWRAAWTIGGGSPSFTAVVVVGIR